MCIGHVILQKYTEYSEVQKYVLQYAIAEMKQIFN